PRQWGACWLALTLWQRLDVDVFFAARLPCSRKGTRWDLAVFVLAAYRLSRPGSEWRLHRERYGRTALADLLGSDDELADPHVPSGAAGRRLARRAALFQRRPRRWRGLFTAGCEVRLCVLTWRCLESAPALDGD